MAATVQLNDILNELRRLLTFLNIIDRMDFILHSLDSYQSLRGAWPQDARFALKLYRSPDDSLSEVFVTHHRVNQTKCTKQQIV